MKQTALFLTLLLVLVACKKKDDRTYSVWYINGEQFMSNNVEYYTNLKNFQSLVCIDKDENNHPLFDFGIVNGNMNLSSNYKISQSSGGVAYHGRHYVAPYNRTFQARAVVDHTTFKIQRISIDTAWLYPSDSTAGGWDSVLVWGTFSQP